MVAAERDDGRGGRDDLDRDGAGRRAAAVEKIPCVIGAFRVCLLPVQHRTPTTSNMPPLLALSPQNLCSTHESSVNLLTSAKIAEGYSSVEAAALRKTSNGSPEGAVAFALCGVDQPPKS